MTDCQFFWTVLRGKCILSLSLDSFDVFRSVPVQKLSLVLTVILKIQKRRLCVIVFFWKNDQFYWRIESFLNSGLGVLLKKNLANPTFPSNILKPRDVTTTIIGYIIEINHSILIFNKLQQYLVWLTLGNVKYLHIHKCYWVIKFY